MSDAASFVPLEPISDVFLSGDKAPSDRPELLKRAQRSLEEARNAFHQARRYMEMWRVLARDGDLIGRMGNYSMALAGFYTIREGMTDALLLAVLRMFEREKNGCRSLSFKKICTDLADPEVQKYLTDWWVRQRQPSPRALAMPVPLDPESKAELEKRTEIVAKEVRQDIAGKFEELAKFNAQLSSEETTKAIDRLKYIRDKEVAHRDLDKPEPAERAVYGDLEDLFELASRILDIADDVARGFAPCQTRMEKQKLQSLCLTSSWREETKEDRAAMERKVSEHPDELEPTTD